MIAQMKIDALSTPLRPFSHGNALNLPDDVTCTVFGSKFIRGNEAADGVMPLADALLEEWETDCHISQYESTPSVRCLKAGQYDLRFSFCMFDLDFDNHGRLPEVEDFARLVSILDFLDHRPNLCYQTRGGARVVFIIEPTTDAEWFEAHWISLMEYIEVPLVRVDCGYRVDTTVKDWSRLFRSARVTRDNMPEFGRQIVLLHEDRLNLDGFKVKKKPVWKPPTCKTPYDGCDLKLLRLIKTEMNEGSRNQTTFKALCHCLRSFNADTVEKAIDAVHQSAANAGLDENEFQQILNSALKQKRENK